MKKILHIFIILFVIVVSSWIEVSFKNVSGTFLIAIMFFLYILNYLVWLREHMNNTVINENIEFVKYRYKRNYSLFTWLGEEKSSDRIIYELIGDIFEKPNNIDTFKNLKEIIDVKINGELIDYYLVREAIKKSRKYSFGEFFQSRLKIIFGTVGVALISIFLKQIKEFELGSFFDLENFFYIVMFLLLLLALISIFYTMWSKSSRRANMVIMILDELIKEKEFIRDSNK